MITSNHFFKQIILLSILICCMPNANAQFIDKIVKKAEKASERAIERKIERKAQKETEKAMDSILNPKKKRKKKKKSKAVISSGGNTDSKRETTIEKEITGTDPIQINRKYDFVPGDKIVVQDDFSKEFEGDLPKNWNTNGGGSIVTFGKDGERWFEINSGNDIFYVPDVVLPQEYTIEFDFAVADLSDRDALFSGFVVMLSTNNKLGKKYNGWWNQNLYKGNGEPYAFFRFSLNQYKYKNEGVHIGNSYGLDNAIDVSLKNTILEQPHISIAVNKMRFRVWVNDQKIADIPRFIEEMDVLKYLKFNLKKLKQGRVFIKDLKITEGGVDLRQQLLNEGKYTSNGILFNSGSSTIKLQSYGIIKQVSQALQRETTMKLKITGHTDSDGSEAENLALSKARAIAVKKALVEVYGIAAKRLITDGKGETTPVADNTSNIGKAQNRRVEFTTY